MPEEVLFKTEHRQRRADIASYLRTVADKLDSGDSITLSASDQSVTLDVPAQPTFEVKAERETSSSGGSAELSVEFELEWDEGSDGEASDDGELSIE
ncbi:amphi-Trp domain-containing protein [Haloprofundus salinisoli]|uniref:amphi-Trp domain-containing protein n=1 Tax=Haloprofundus salinisoli TaxID=2876193 RepID=UPI001CCF799F|nr:amphi-Trp domain-containing protein [Haloprofundus salinisoli]